MKNIFRFFYSTKLISCPLMLLFVLLGSRSLFAQPFKVQGAHTLQAYHRGKTKPLSELAPMPNTPKAKQVWKKSNKPVFTPPNFINYRRQPKANPDALPIGLDPVRQDAIYQHRAAPVQPTLLLEGIDEATSEVGVPDTNGDVGPDHYVQIVNASWFQVFAKDGTPLTPPTSANTIWSQINKMSFSDPVIVFDEAAGRWLLTDLAGFDEVLYGVSETSNPLGAWDLYSFITPSLPDYPKYGVWPNAYIFTINEGSGVYPVYALNRAQMLAGEATIDVQRIDIPGIDGGFPTATPMDWNGPNAPATDEAFVVRLNDDAWGNGNTNDLLEVWSLNIDWANPNNSTASETALVTAPYDSDGCSIGGAFDFACIEQPGTPQGIDGIMTIVMNRVVYRNFGTHESAVLTFSVDATGNDVAGIRWMELRRTPGNDWAIYQEGTFAPNDGISRFIGSIAINGKGDIALAYSVSGPNTFPSLRYTGRREGDPLGEMTVDEFEFATGSGVRSGDRYGDYANMAVDPIDDSFWFTSEYVLNDDLFGTKIVQFSLGRDTFDIAPVALVAPVNSPGLGSQEPVTLRVRNLGLEPASGFSVGYSFLNGTAVVEPATIGTLLPDSIYEHTFASTVDMSTIGAYTFKAFTTFTADQNTRNDTLRQERRKLPRFDAGIAGVNGLDQLVCDTAVSVELLLTNFGTETLTSVTIQTQVNGGIPNSINWAGSLASGATTIVSLPVSALTNGINNLVVRTLLPNGVADQVPSNDQFARTFQVVLGGETVTFELRFDFFPEETSWNLKDEAGNILYSGDNYNVEFDTLVVNWCLPPQACYTFSIFDAYGDGIEGFFGGQDGSYSITDANGTVLASILNVDFGFQEDNSFCIGVNCSVGYDVNVTHESGINNADGAIFVSISSGASPFEYSIDNGATYQIFPLFSGLSGGVYPVAVRDVNGCVTRFSVTIETIIASSEQLLSGDVKVYPNPSENGAFQLHVGNPDQHHGPLEVQVVDANGRTVLYHSLPLVDDAFSGLLSLRAYPAGIYYVRCKHEKMNQLVKLVKL